MTDYEHCQECGGMMFPTRPGSDIYECEVCGNTEEFATA